jgi:hypothetical protein
MKLFKLIGLEHYTVANTVEDATQSYIINKFGVTINNVKEIPSDKRYSSDAFGKIFKDLKELSDYELQKNI